MHIFFYSLTQVFTLTSMSTSHLHRQANICVCKDLFKEIVMHFVNLNSIRATNAISAACFDDYIDTCYLFVKTGKGHLRLKCL